MITSAKCPLCHSLLETKEGLEGMWCTNEGCNYYSPDNPTSAQLASDGYKLDEERLKKLRGVPCSKYCIGSETKGHIEVQIPFDATETEIKGEIDKAVKSMKYLVSQVKENELDIFSSRKKKEEI